MGKYLDKEGVETLWNKAKELNAQKQDRTSADLTTKAKGIVEAINEVNGKAGLRLLGTLSPGDPAPAAEQSEDGYYLAVQPGQYFNGSWLHKTHIGIVTQQDGRWRIKFVRTEPMPKPRVIAWRAIPLKTARPGDIYIISRRIWLKVSHPKGLLQVRNINENQIKKVTIPDDWANMDETTAFNYITTTMTDISTDDSYLTLSSPYLNFIVTQGIPIGIVSTHPPFAMQQSPLRRNNPQAYSLINMKKMMVMYDHKRSGNHSRIRLIAGTDPEINFFNAAPSFAKISRRKYFSLRRAKAIMQMITVNKSIQYAFTYIHKSSVLTWYKRYNNYVDPFDSKKKKEYTGCVSV